MDITKDMGAQQQSDGSRNSRLVWPIWDTVETGKLFQHGKFANMRHLHKNS